MNAPLPFLEKTSFPLKFGAIANLFNPPYISGQYFKFSENFRDPVWTRLKPPTCEKTLPDSLRKQKVFLKFILFLNFMRPQIHNTHKS